MKCQKCDRVATFHITEMIDAVPRELHLCDLCAYEYLHQNDARRSPDPPKRRAPIDYGEKCAEKGADLKEATEELETSEFEVCPCCGFGFHEFRRSGKLGCPSDYETFRERLEPLIYSIHGSLEHRGKSPARRDAAKRGAALVQLRAELADAIEIEDYERASKLRDAIAELTAAKDNAAKETAAKESATR